VDRQHIFFAIKYLYVILIIEVLYGDIMNRFKRIKPKQRKRRNNILPFFLLLLLCMGIGYAYLTSNLSISGNTNVSTNPWNIFFHNI
jgi:hypothetical protein